MDLKKDLFDIILAFCLNNGVLLAGFIALTVIGFDFYQRYVKVIRNDYNVNMMNRYLWLQMHRRYHENFRTNGNDSVNFDSTEKF